LLVPDHDVLFGASLGQWNGADAADAAGRIRFGVQADRDGLDLFTVADHPYFGDKLDAYALTGFLLGQTERITGMVTVTNLPSRPAPLLARTLTSLSALSGGRVILGIGAGADPAGRLGLAEPALPRVPSPGRRRRGRGGPRPGGDRPRRPRGDHPVGRPPLKPDRPHPAPP
jgi:alkanesulfonate monooxygenase SsuD/methylene tetrahydromethanopterin reductase-like flavin-dependent oxidoreductase (luciferase family)